MKNKKLSKILDNLTVGKIKKIVAMQLINELYDGINSENIQQEKEQEIKEKYTKYKTQFLDIFREALHISADEVILNHDKLSTYADELDLVEFIMRLERDLNFIVPDDKINLDDLDQTIEHFIVATFGEYFSEVKELAVKHALKTKHG